MPIPILRLPYVALNEVMKTMGFSQLFTLSLCSKRMNLAAKNLRGNPINLTVKVMAGKTIDIQLLDKGQRNTLFGLSIESMPEVHKEGWSIDRFGGTSFQEDISRLELRSYWEDVEGGTVTFLEYMADLFRASITDVRVYKNRYLWMFEWVEQRQGPRSYTAYVNDQLNGLTDGQFRRLLVDLSPFDLQLETPSEKFMVKNPRLNYKSLCISKWIRFNIDNLLTIDCTRLMVQNPRFTATEMNRFLRNVLTNEASRLIEFDATLQSNHESERILDGLREVLTAARGKEQFLENSGSWKFSGMLKREGRSAHVSIQCFPGDAWPAISLKRIGG